MEYRNFDAVNFPKKWSEKRRKLQELRAMHHFVHHPGTTSETPEIPQSKGEKLEESFKNAFRSKRQKQKQRIIGRFIDHCHPAKKVYDRLTSFLDNYQRCQKDLKQSDLSMGQLQAMHSFIQTFLEKVDESLTSDQRFPEAAKGDIKAFFDMHLQEMNAAKDEMYGLKRNKPFGSYSETILECMANLQKELAKFAEKLE